MHARTQRLPFFLWFHDLLTFIRVNYLEIKNVTAKDENIITIYMKISDF